MRKATNGNFVLGHDRFAREVERLLKARVRAGKPGRPKAHKDVETRNLF